MKRKSSLRASDEVDEIIDDSCRRSRVTVPRRNERVHFKTVTPPAVPQWNDVSNWNARRDDFA
jgi:hypothetical protein